MMGVEIPHFNFPPFEVILMQMSSSPYFQLPQACFTIYSFSHKVPDSRSKRLLA